MAVRKKIKLPFEKKKAAVSSKKSNAGKGKKQQRKNPIKPVKVSKLKKPAKKKLTALVKIVKKKVFVKTASKVKSPAKPKKKIVAATKLPKKKQSQRAKPAKNIKTNGERLHLLRKSLIAKRDSILKEAKEELAKYISGENRQLVDTALDDDWAVVDTSEDLNLMRLTTQRSTLFEINEALRKIAEDTYGICEECGDEISEKRLSIMPSATLCINCQEDKERLEAIEKEDLR